MEIKEFNESDLEPVYNLIQNTIDISYCQVYPREAIEFFKEWHSKERILNDAVAGYTIVTRHNNEILGTGTLLDTNIRRVFVSPFNQRTGIGKQIVYNLENKATVEKLLSVELEASLVSKQFWESFGFFVEREDFVTVRNDRKLHYFKMVKTMGAINNSTS